MPRKTHPDHQPRVKLNLTIHPEIRAYADEISLKRRRSISQLFEDLIDAEWQRVHHPAPPATPPQPIYYAPPGYPPTAFQQAV